MSKRYPILIFQYLQNNPLLLFPITITSFTITTSKLISFEVDLINLRIDKKPVPSSLQEMPDESGLAVEEAEFGEVAVGEVECRAGKER